MEQNKIKYWHYWYKEKIQLYDEDLRKIGSIDYKGTCPEYELWKQLGEDYNGIEQLTELSTLPEARNLEEANKLLARLQKENKLLRKDFHKFKVDHTAPFTN